MILVTISHVVNVLVAGGVAGMLLANAPWMARVYGGATPARSILASVYLAIAVTSLVALLVPASSIVIAQVLFPLQIFYKLTTIIAVGTIAHPVVISNVLISVLHTASLLVIFV